MLQYKTIIFDWSGTISDDRIPVYEANRRLLLKFNRPILPFEKFIEEALVSFEDFAKTLGLTQEGLFQHYEKHYHEVIEEGIQPTPYPDTKYTLEFLTKINTNLMVLSSHPQSALEREAESYGIRECFNSLHGSSKNKAQDLIGVCNTHNFQHKILYVGDMTHDIKAAKQANIDSAAVCTGYHSRKKLEAEHPSKGVFNSLTELIHSIL